MVKGSKWREIEARVAEPRRHVEEKERGARGEGGEEEEAFRRSKKTVRLPYAEKGFGGEVEGMLRKLMREELGEVIKEIEKVRGWREKVTGWREEMRKERGGSQVNWGGI